MMQKLKFFHRAPNGIRLDGERERWKDVEGYGAESKKGRTICRRLRHWLSATRYFGTSLTSKKALLPCGNCAYMHIGSCCLLQEADGELMVASVKPPGC